MWLKQLTVRDIAIFVVAILGVLAYVMAAELMGGVGFPLDDAWIHQTYARNLANAGQWAFVPGEPSAGSTAPLYTLLLSLGYVLRLPYMWWTMVLGVFTLAVAGMVAARLAGYLAPDIRGIGWWAGLAVAGSWHLVWAAASGMETMLFSMLTLVLVWLAWRELRISDDTLRNAVGRGGLLGICGAVTMLARPEGIGLVGLIGLGMWVASPQRDSRLLLGWSVGVGLGWLVGFVPYALFNLGLGGSILPNTASAKQAEQAILLEVSYPGRVLNLLFPLSAGGQLALLPGIVVSAVEFIKQIRLQRQAILLLVPVIWAVSLIGLYAARLPAPYQHGRYVIPALPHLILVGVVGTGIMLQRTKMSALGRVIGRTVALTAIALFVLFWGLGAQQYGRDVQIIESEMVVTARWLAEHIAPEDLLAVHDIGAVGYFAPRPILDLAGLVSPEVIPVIRDTAGLWTLMADQDVQYIMALPDQLPGQNELDQRLCPVFSSEGEWAPQFGGANMKVYRVAWDGGC